MGTSDVMEVDASHLTFLTDLCVAFVDPSRVGTRIPKMAALSFLIRAAASTFTLHRGSGGNKSKRVPACVAAHLFMRVRSCGAGGLRL